jgi:RimJ/RimL family protein N-acetyltransferase
MSKTLFVAVGGHIIMLLAVPSLLGQTVRVEQLLHAHAASLWHFAEPSLFTSPVLRPAGLSRDAFDGHIERTLTMSDWYPVVIALHETDELISLASYRAIRSAHHGLEIGATSLKRAHQGTTAIPDAKLLLRRYGLETLRMARAQLKTDARNIQSQRAIAHRGALREGVLRRHMLRLDGYVRDMVICRIIDHARSPVRAATERTYPHAVDMRAALECPALGFG